MSAGEYLSALDDLTWIAIGVLLLLVALGAFNKNGGGQ